MDDYSKTLNLPKTEFPMRAGLPQKEPEILKKWQEMRLYDQIMKKNSELSKYILHDGPPFANGDIHIGHALNKVLKDVTVKYKAMTGHFTPYIPGWDTHGLPIEQQAIKKLKLNKEQVDPKEFRNTCRDFALKYVDNQKGQFQRLGAIGDWDNPYLTLAPQFEASQIRVFGKMVEKGFIYRDLKSVYWCTECETALAEAEIEYKGDTATSIYVKFKIVDDKGIGLKDAYIVIWTTTTWTLPANVGIALNARFEYSVVEANGERYVIATELADDVMSAAGITDYATVRTFKGSELEQIKCAHPFLKRESLVINGDLVTLEFGTGCVHIAPGHGVEDNIIGRKYGLPIIVPVNSKGVLTDEAGQFVDLHYKKSNKTIFEYLENNDHLLTSTPIDHQYPHCWRCLDPIIFRATKQWFASVDGFKKEALGAVASVKWIPEWGEERIAGMIRDRDDWCISRQRLWGMPIPIFYCEDCNEPIMDVNLINDVADVFKEKGSNAWFEMTAEEFMPKDYTCSCGGKAFRKETDTMDVWFDSGSTHVGVLENREGLHAPADLYLEGNDQYRGWFQSSLLTSVAYRGGAPYKAVVTHGFVVDGQGRKMSKSLGNGMPPFDIIDEYGADILRLWAVSSDYKVDVRISKDILKQLSEIYRKIRNTARFMLANISDFDPSGKTTELNELDRWAISQTNKLIKKVKTAYENFDFHIFYHATHNFCVVEMSNFYLDIIKDRLYTQDENSHLRRSSQTAMYEILNALVKLLAPVISFTAEEIWGYIPGNVEESVFLTRIPDEIPNKFDQEAKWEKLIELRDSVSKALETARENKMIGNSLEAKLKLTISTEDYNLLKDMSNWDLCQVFIISELELLEGDFDIAISKSSGDKCPRCWMYTCNNSELCKRCSEVLK